MSIYQNAVLGFRTTPMQNDRIGVVPEGQYLVSITKADYVENRNGTGMVLKLQETICEGEEIGYILHECLNIRHANIIAEQFSKRILDGILNAVNIPYLKDYKDLIGKKMHVDVGIRHTDIYGDKNEIRKHSLIDQKYNINNKGLYCDYCGAPRTIGHNCKYCNSSSYFSK